MKKREEELAAMEANGSLEAAKYMHIDDLSSDDEEAGNTIGNVPLHWYDDHDHITSMILQLGPPPHYHQT